jgi:probable DNA repair protein
MIVTANARLARSLQREYGAQQLAAGRTAWQTPTILPWAAFLQRFAEGDKPPLTPIQEQALWESIVEASPESVNLIQPQAAARLAAEAWKLIHEWLIPMAGKKHAGAWESTAETKTFYGWAQQFEFHLRWLDRTYSPRLLTGPPELALAGFDEFTPRQLEVLATLEKSGTLVTHLPAPARSGTAKLAALDDEPEAAAAWCRSRLDGKVGVVVQGLQERRHRWERAFRLAVPGAFHIALGPQLAARPMVAVALKMLEFGAGRVPWETVSSLLLSPWVAGFNQEQSRRAAVEVSLRRYRDLDLTRACPPILSRALWRIDTFRQTSTEEQKPSAWTKTFAAILEAFGWPGDETPGSSEYQVMQAWRATLSELASTDIAVGAVSRHRALEMLRRLARDKRFEVESAGEPIQIMGLLEAAGASFDHLWIAGMNDEVWPARPAPNPFIPLALQRQYKLPHSSPARELAFARRVSERLLQSADEVVVSYTKADTERELAPSPLLAGLPEFRHEERLHTFVTPEFETLIDTMGPPVTATTGGTRALELQAKCPFRAFAEIRLGARELETPEPGLDPRERGGFIHSALEYFWKRYPTADVAESVDFALAKFKVGDDELAKKLIALERVRLIELIQSWVDFEKLREMEFTVEEPEQERTVEIGGLTVKVRLDRLDKLANGLYALIDYKSKAPKLGDWDGDRPESPQVPIYAVTSREPLAALAFAQVRTGENLFKGYSTIDGVLPGIKPIDAGELDGRIAEWRRVLEALGQDFRRGRAPVDPKDQFKTCDFCHLSALCRVEER